MNSARTHIGVDVGKGWLDVCHPDGQKEHVRNIRSCRAKPIKRAMKLNAIVSFGATGPYEEPLAEECLAKGVKAVRLDAWGSRQYAKSQGLPEKTDRIDCEVIRDCAGSLGECRPHCVKPRPEARKRLKKAIGVRKSLQKAKPIVFSQLEHVRDPEIKKQIASLLSKLDSEIDGLESECDRAIAEDERTRTLYARFREIKGVGPCTARALLAHCPDIGEFTRGGIVKYCGVGPLENGGCTIVRKSRPKRGRADLRQALHMAAASVSRSNLVLRPIGRRLLANGKGKTVALQAVARHIAIALNTIAKHPDFRLERDPKDIARQASQGRVSRSPGFIPFAAVLRRRRKSFATRDRLPHMARATKPSEMRKSPTSFPASPFFPFNLPNPLPSTTGKKTQRSWLTTVPDAFSVLRPARVGSVFAICPAV